MERWQAHFRDKLHDIDCVIENDYGEGEVWQHLKLCIDGITFWGTELDDWELSEKVSGAELEEAQRKFSLTKWGKKESGYRYMLQEYSLSMKIPTKVWDIEKKCKIEAELNIAFEVKEDKEKSRCRFCLDEGSVLVNVSVCDRFALNVGEACFMVQKPICTSRGSTKKI